MVVGHSALYEAVEVKEAQYDTCLDQCVSDSHLHNVGDNCRLTRMRPVCHH